MIATKHSVAGLSVSEPSLSLSLSLSLSPSSGPLNRRFLQTHCSYSCHGHGERKTSGIRLTTQYRQKEERQREGGREREREREPPFSSLFHPKLSQTNSSTSLHVSSGNQCSGRGGQEGTRGETISPLTHTHTKYNAQRSATRATDKFLDLRAQKCSSKYLGLLQTICVQNYRLSGEREQFV